MPADVEGPAFPPFIKAVSSALLLALAVAAVQAAGQIEWSELGLGGWVIAALLVVVIGGGWWQVMTARSGFDGRTLRLRGLRSRSVALDSVTHVKLVHLPGLEWLLVPRLVVRTRGFGMATFHTADPAVLAAFRGLVGRG